MHGQIEYLSGQVLATQAALRAIILLTPEPALAAKHVAEHLERWLSVGLANANTTEPMLQGIERARDAILPSAADLARLFES